MADVKISQLPVATTITAGVDVAPIVSAGVTSKATLSALVNAALQSPGPIGLGTPNAGVFTTAAVLNLSGLVKANAGILANAISGTDYAPATSGASILYGNNAGGFSNVTVGSGLSFSAGTLSSTSGGGSVTSVGLTMPSGFSVANSPITGAGTLAVTTSLSGIIKGNGSGFTSATAGGDYAVPPVGSSILYGNGIGGFSNVTVGSGLQFVGGTLSVTAAGGSVTTVSVASANGFAGTVSNPTTTPEITLTTSISGILYGSGNALNAVTIGSGLSFAGGTLSATGGGAGVSAVTATSPLASSGGSTPDISIQQASGSQSGYLSSTDWTTFNSKGSGTVTSVAGTGTVNGLTLTGTVTSTGSLTLGGTLDLSAPPAIGGTTPNSATFTGVSSPVFSATTSAGGTLKSNSGTSCLQWGAGGGSNVIFDGGISANAANATITLSPTGTGTVTVAPATAGTINNVAIGGTTAAAGTFTALTATGTTTLATSLTGLLKATSGVVSTATAGTDYVTPTGTETLTNKTIEAGTFTNGYTEETYTANSGTAITLSLANGTMQLITLTGSPTITMPTAAAGKSFTLILYTGTGSYTVSWSTVAWAGGTTPTVTTTASKKDIFNFYSDGTNWYGSIFGQSF